MLPHIPIHFDEKIFIIKMNANKVYQQKYLHVNVETLARMVLVVELIDDLLSSIARMNETTKSFDSITSILRKILTYKVFQAYII